MKDYYLFTTPSGNRYCLNIANGALLLCHPLFYEIISIHRRGESVRAWYDAIPRNGPLVLGHERWERAELDHYYNKFSFLHNAGLFSEHDRHAAVSTRLTAEDVTMSLRGTNAVAFELTEACNLRCIYCCYGDCYEASSHRSGRHLDPETATMVLTQLFSIWTEFGNDVPHEITVAFYGGEPLLRIPAIEQIMRSVRLLNHSNRPLRFKMTSNALLLDEYADFLAENDVELLISLDGDAKSDSYRVMPDGTESHTRVLDNAMMLKQRHPDYFRQKVDFNAVFNNRSSVDRLYEFFKDNFDKVPLIAPLSFFGTDPDNRELLKAMDGNLRHSVEQSQRRAEIARAMFTRLPPASYTGMLLTRAYPLQFQDYAELLSHTPDTPWLPTGTCMPFSKGLFVTVDGEILPCERIGDRMPLGRVGPTGVEVDCESIAQRYNTYYDRVTQLCGECHHRKTCPNCMFQLDFTDTDVQCPEFASEETFIEYLIDVIGNLEEERWIVSRTFNDTMVM